MLKQLSRLERSRKLVIVGFAFLMALSLIVFFAPRPGASSVEPTKSEEVLAKVNGDEVTVGQFALQRESIQQRFSQYGSQISLAQMGFSDQRILDGLVQQRIVAQEAARLGLSASDAEVAEDIRHQFADPAGNVDIARYKEVVNSRYGGVERFEAAERDRISGEKLRALVTAGVRVSEDEVREQFKRKETFFDVTYVTVSADKLAAKIDVPDADLRSYYDQHREQYKIQVPQKKIRYLFIDLAKVGEKLQISDKDLRAEYDKLAPSNKMAGVKVQQIVLKVARKDLEAPVEQKTKDLIAKLRGTTGQATEQAFAELARGNSEDPATAKTGGFLPRPVKKNPNKIDALYERAVDMQPGDVTDVPIKYGSAYYILRRGEEVQKTFEEAKPELLASLRNRRAYAAAAKLAERAQARFKETKDAQKVAQELAAEANMSPAEMIKETPYIKPGDDVPNIGNSQQFEDGIAPLDNINDIGERTSIKGGFAIPMLVDKKEPRIPDFEEVKDKVAKVVRDERAHAQLEQKAKELIASVKGPGDLKAAAEQMGFDVATEVDYKLNAPLGKAGTSPELDEAIYALKVGEVTKTPAKVGDNWVIAGLTKTVPADLTKFASQRSELMKSALAEQQGLVFEGYIGAVRDKFQREGRIKVYQDVLARLQEAEPAALPRGMPNFPIPPSQ
ncbi:MAG: peptidyl-prolyl cis-trans isomerase [Blastocatellia bacterium]|jgi:peptidyl-prolyl cis-trans isomerase D|nr:peptidyl-prolyl cis-trans isomerase [Blastocatellia bacterium]